MEDKKKYNKHIYCIENLSEDDRSLLTFWRDTIYGVLDTAMKVHYDDAVDTLDDIKAEVISNFCVRLKGVFGLLIQDFLVDVIDNYKYEPKYEANPTTFIYNPEKDSKEHDPDIEEDDEIFFKFDVIDKITTAIFDNNIGTFFELTKYVAKNCSEEERKIFYRNDRYFVDLMKSKG